MDLNILYYAVAGLAGGIVYVLIPPMVTDLKAIIQHVVLGAIAGGVVYLGLLSQDPTQIGAPISYLTTLTSGYLAIDVLTKLLGSKTASSNSIPGGYNS